MQARQMMNEIHELKATLSQVNNRSTPISVAAFHWLQNIYLPTVEKLNSGPGEPGKQADPAEGYCQVLEHKWYLSERQGQDVGHSTAAADYLRMVRRDSPD
jgi:hypothetical protein